MMRPRRCRVDLSELAKDQIVMFGCDSHASVTDLDEQLGSVPATSLLGFQPHTPARRREVDRIAERCAELGCAAVMLKPVPTRELLRRAEAWLA